MYGNCRPHCSGHVWGGSVLCEGLGGVGVGQGENTQLRKIGNVARLAECRPSMPRTPGLTLGAAYIGSGGVKLHRHLNGGVSKAMKCSHPQPRKYSIKISLNIPLEGECVSQKAA